MLKNKLNQAALAGTKGYTRTLDFNFFKLTEEVGELAVEIQIEQGRLPAEKGGEDGVIGEAIDVALVALDVAFLALHKQGINDLGTMEKLLDQIAKNKLDKWKVKLKKLQENDNDQ